MGNIGSGEASPALSVRVLGPLEVSVATRPVPLGGPKQRAVLAALVLAAGRVVSSDSIAASVWNDDPPADYSATLHVLVANLRRELRAAGVDAKSVLMTAAPGYRLPLSPPQWDYGRFVTKCTEAHEHLAARRFDDAWRAFRSGMDEFSGDPLADLRGVRFAEDFAAVVAEERLEAFTALMGAENACGRSRFIVNELAATARDHPLREPLWAQLVIALYALGRQADALEACRRVRTNLADMLGIDPGPQLADLEERILRQESVADMGSFTMSTTLHENSIRLSAAQLCPADGPPVPVPAKGLRIGRMPDNELVLTDARVSRYHAVVNRTVGGYVIRDLRSANGVKVGDEHVVDVALLSDGDEIRIGAQSWVFRHAQ